MAIIDIKTRDNIRMAMRELNVSDVLRIPFKYATTNHLKVIASQLKKEEGLEFHVKSKGQMIYQLVTRSK